MKRGNGRKAREMMRKTVWRATAAAVMAFSFLAGGLGGPEAMAGERRKRSDAEYEQMYRAALAKMESKAVSADAKAETDKPADPKAETKPAKRNAVSETAESAKQVEPAKQTMPTKQAMPEETPERSAKAKDLAEKGVYELPEGRGIALRPSAPAKELRTLVPLTGGTLTQAGGTMVNVQFEGRKLPEPLVFVRGPKLIFLFPETWLKMKKEDFNAASGQLFSSLDMFQNGRDAVVEFHAKVPVQMLDKQVFAPADTMTYRFVSKDSVEKKVAESKIPQAKRAAPVRADSGPFSSKVFVNLELRDTELKDLFRMLGGYMKKNVIVDPSVPQAAITMTMKQVPLSEIFEYLMKTYDIWYHVIGQNTVVVGTREGLAKISDELDTRSYRTAYGEPKELAPILVSLLRIPAENVLVDERLKTIVITAGERNHQRAVEILRKMDKPGRQVMLTAKIVEFAKSAGKEMDAAVNMVYDHWHLNSVSGGLNTGLMRGVGRYLRPRANDLYREPDNDAGGSFLPKITDPKNVIDGMFREFDAAIKLMEKSGKGEMVASPSVIAIDGLEASISLTEDYPYVSERDDAGNPSWSTKTVGPQLKLTPHVGRDGIITVKVDIQTGEVIEMMAGSNGEQMPKTSNRSVATTVRIRNGEPFVVGGLHRDTKTSKISKVPVLGDLPILGNLFRSKGFTRNKTEAVIVVVPYIIDTPDVDIETEFVTNRW